MKLKGGMKKSEHAGHRMFDAGRGRHVVQKMTCVPVR